jgi:hypothetical protein
MLAKLIELRSYYNENKIFYHLRNINSEISTLKISPKLNVLFSEDHLPESNNHF